LVSDTKRRTQIENRLLSGIFPAKEEEVAGGYRKLHNVELHNLYASPNTIMLMNEIKEDEMDGHVERMR
jgi:hypothetical protein